MADDGSTGNRTETRYTHTMHVVVKTGSNHLLPDRNGSFQSVDAVVNGIHCFLTMDG